MLAIRKVEGYIARAIGTAEVYAVASIAKLYIGIGKRDRTAAEMKRGFLRFIAAERDFRSKSTRFCENHIVCHKAEGQPSAVFIEKLFVNLNFGRRSTSDFL